MSFHTTRNSNTALATLSINDDTDTGISTSAANTAALMAGGVEGVVATATTVSIKPAGVSSIEATATSVAIKPGGTAVVTYTSTGVQAAQTSVNLVKSTPTTFLTVTLPTTMDYFAGVVDYCISATDATDRQTVSGSVFVSGVRKTTATTGGVGIVGTQVNAVSAGTHTNTFTVADATGGVLNFKANSVPSITPSAGAGHKIDYSFRLAAGSPTVALS